MKIIRSILSLSLALYMSGAGQLSWSQDANAGSYNITLAPLQYANVKGNLGKFESLNWMSNGETAGVSNISFVKDINKNISVEGEGSVYPGVDTGDGHLVLKDGDIAFLKIDYNAYRKYYDNTGAVDRDTAIITVPNSVQGVQANSPNLDLNISYFKLEAGVGAIDDPFLDLSYEHNSKDGDKSLLQWSPAYVGSSAVYRKIGPTYQSVDDTSDTITLNEKKDVAGVTIKGQQTAEVDYNHNDTYMQYLTDGVTAGARYSQLSSENEYIDAKLFGSGVRLEKWLFNDNVFTGFGYHYSHIKSSEEMQNLAQTETTGIINPPTLFTGQANQSLWNYSTASEDEHVFTGNINANLTKDLAFLLDGRYQHMGADGYSYYYAEPAAGSYPQAPSSVNYMQMANHNDSEGEHAAFHYSGLPHTSLYVESEGEQGRNWTWQYLDNLLNPAMNATSSNFFIDRLNNSHKESWTAGGKIVPNRFFTFTTQVKQRWEDNEYDTIALTGSPSNQTFLDALKVNGIEDASTLTWRPNHWLSNSFRYQFDDTDYLPREAAEGQTAPTGGFSFSKNHMLTSAFTYEITVQPIDPLMFMISYSHVENYVRTIQASQPGVPNSYAYIPTFNSGDNSWLFSSTYTPTESLTWTNTVCYTISDNYVDFSTGIPLGTSFKMINYSSDLMWTYHKWLKMGPGYEYAAYRDNPLVGTGNYTANIFKFTVGFNW